MAKKTKNTMRIGEDYITIQKMLNRELELERNGGRWIQVDRPHKNKKLYNRKRDRKINFDNLPLFLFIKTFGVPYSFSFSPYCM